MLKAFKDKRRRGKQFLKASVGLVENTVDEDLDRLLQLSHVFERYIYALLQATEKHRQMHVKALEMERNMFLKFSETLAPHEEFQEKGIPLGEAALHYGELLNEFEIKQKKLLDDFDSRVIDRLTVYKDELFPQLRKKASDHEGFRADYDSYRGRLATAKKHLEVKKEKGGDSSAELMHVEKLDAKFKNSKEKYQNSHTELTSQLEGLLITRREQLADLFSCAVSLQLKESPKLLLAMQSEILEKWDAELLESVGVTRNSVEPGNGLPKASSSNVDVGTQTSVPPKPKSKPPSMPNLGHSGVAPLPLKPNSPPPVPRRE